MQSPVDDVDGSISTSLARRARGSVDLEAI